MIVDDSETIRAVVERSLTMTKLPIQEIIMAVNGKDALAQLQTKWVDIVFSDINMPELDGIGLVDAMKSDRELQKVPIVIVSTEGSITRINSLKSKGISGYLRKPFTPENLRDIIIATLGAWND